MNVFSRGAAQCAGRNLALVLIAATASVAHGAADERRVVMLDACDGPTFNAAIGAPVCERDGGVTFDKFIAQLVRLGEAPAWRFAPESLRLAVGGTTEAYNGGGEAAKLP